MQWILPPILQKVNRLARLGVPRTGRMYTPDEFGVCHGFPVETDWVSALGPLTGRGGIHPTYGGRGFACKAKNGYTY